MPADEVPSNLAAALRAARRHGGYTQEAAARALGISGSTYTKWEHAANTPSIANVLAFEALCGLPRGWIFRRAGLIAPEGGDTRSAITSDPRLPEEARASLAALYDALVADDDDPPAAPTLDVLRTLGPDQSGT